MALILFVTCDRWPELSQSDSLVAQALVDRGYHVEAAPWQGDFARFQSADLILLRSQWDYHHVMAGFTTWLQRLAETALQVYNPVSLVHWNLYKEIGDVPRNYGLENPRNLVSESYASKSPYRRPRSAAPYH